MSIDINALLDQISKNSSSAMDFQASQLNSQLSAQKSIAKLQASTSKDIAAANNKTQLKIAEGGWKVQREGIAAQLEIAKNNLQFQYDQMEQIGIPTLELDRWYKQQQIQLAEKAHQLAQANLGLEYLKFASTLRGPANVFQFSDFINGAQRTGDVPASLNALLNNVPVASFGAPNASLGNNSLTPGYLAQALGGTTDPHGQQLINPNHPELGYVQSPNQEGSTFGTYNVDSILSKYSDLFNQGAHRLSPGSIESMSDFDMQIMQSAADKLGVDLPTWLKGYTNSRIGNESGLLA